MQPGEALWNSSSCACTWELFMNGICCLQGSHMRRSRGDNRPYCIKGQIFKQCNLNYLLCHTEPCVERSNDDLVRKSCRHGLHNPVHQRLKGRVGWPNGALITLRNPDSHPIKRAGVGISDVLEPVSEDAKRLPCPLLRVNLQSRYCQTVYW